VWLTVKKRPSLAARSTLTNHRGRRESVSNAASRSARSGGPRIRVHLRSPQSRTECRSSHSPMVILSRPRQMGKLLHYHPGRLYLTSKIQRQCSARGVRLVTRSNQGRSRCRRRLPDWQTRSNGHQHQCHHHRNTILTHLSDGLHTFHSHSQME